MTFSFCYMFIYLQFCQCHLLGLSTQTQIQLKNDYEPYPIPQYTHSLVCFLAERKGICTAVLHYAFKHLIKNSSV